MQGSDYSYQDITFIPEVDDISEINMGLNTVLVKPNINTSTLQCGLHIDTSWNEIQCSARVVEVVKLPSVFAVRGKKHYDASHSFALPWDNDMDLEVGDIAWVDPLSVVLNNNTNLITHFYTCKNQLYFAVNYSRFIVAKRGDQVIMLNGHILLEQMMKDVGFMDYKKEIPDDKCKVCYVGKPNRYYHDRPYSDKIEIEVGDIVSDPKNKIYLEDSLYAKFEGKKEFIVAKRKDILFSFKDLNMSLESINIHPGHALVKRDVKEETVSGIILPDAESKTTGVVVKLGPERDDEHLEGLKVGSKVDFFQYAREITIKDETYLLMDVQSINYWV